MRTVHLATLLVLATAGCSDWTPIRSAKDYEGQRVRIESGAKPVVIDELVLCDNDGYLIARKDVDCQQPGPPLKFDTRRDKVSLYSPGDVKGKADVVVAGVLAAILIPAAIVVSAYFSGGISL